MFLGKKEDKCGKVDTIIGAEAEIKGNVVSKATIRVDGKVEGDFTCEGDIIIGKEGRIKGDLKGANIMMSGKVHGNIHADMKVEILESGHLVGDMKAATVVIVEGGMFEGHCEMHAREKSKILEIPEKEQRTAGLKGK